MTDLEILQQGTINALREQLRQQAEKPCPVCAAKDQTITLLADVVDWHRAQVSISASPASSASPAGPMPQFAPPGDLWSTDEEEDVYAALADGSMDNESAERALAFIQAQHQTLTVVK